MSLSPRVSLIGRSNIDYVIAKATVAYTPKSVTLHLPGSSFTVTTRQYPGPGGKVAADIPAKALALADLVRWGGGAFNSAFAYRLISNQPIRYLDACSPEVYLTRETTKLNLDARYLGFYPSPCNLVVGSDSDKIILKSPVPAVAGLTESQAEAIHWACEAPFVGVNSIADPAVMRQVAQASAKSGAKLLSMITPGLPTGLITGEVIPASKAVLVAWDEVGRVLGRDFSANREGSYHALLHLHRIAPTATIFITLGRDGVLVWGPDAGPARVALRPPAFTAVQEWIAHEPSRACGCGDAFFAGAMAWYAEGNSLASGLEEQDDAIQATISGCATAVRWTGYLEGLNADDFSVVPLDSDPAENLANAA